MVIILIGGVIMDQDILLQIYNHFERAVSEWDSCDDSGRCYADFKDKCYNDLHPLYQGVLYHYTTLDALFSISSSGILRLSNCMVLNDSRETKHTQTLITEVLSKDSFLAQNIDLNSKQFSRLFDMDNVFVLSLSKSNDSMPMWYYYAAGDGCNFILDYSKLESLICNWKNKCLLTKYAPISNSYDKKEAEDIVRKIVLNSDSRDVILKEAIAFIRHPNRQNNSASWYIDNNRPSLQDRPAWGYSNTQEWFYDISKVIYCRDKQKRIIERILQCYVDTKQIPKYRGYSSAITSALIKKLKRCAIFFKDDMFYPEEEVRLAVIIHPDLLKHIVCYYEKRGAIIPYIQFNVKANQTSSFMQNIIVGPGNKLDIALDSIKNYLQSIGCKEPKVELSRAPLRYYK